MKIKSLLLGSAAAMLAVSGASAADAIVAAEPEPVEYVRVCDAFGAGYFYIPGTETCLRLSGYTRFRLFSDDDADSYYSLAKVELNWDAKEDTEWGVLHGYARINAEYSSSPSFSVTTPTVGSSGTATYAASGSSIAFEHAYVALGGLLAGHYDSTWATSTNGGKSGYGAHGIYTLNYGFQTRNMIQYQFTGTNWFAAVAVEDDANINSWDPDVVGRLGGVVGGITIFGVAGYDATASEWGAKLGLNMDVGAAGNLRVQGYYASGANSYAANMKAFTALPTAAAAATFTPEWAVLASYQHQFTPEFAANIKGEWMSNLYNSSNVQTGADAYIVAGGIVWTPIDNFRVRSDVEYRNISNTAAAGIIAQDHEDWRGVIELQRSF